MGGGREWRGGATEQATGPQSSETQKSEYLKQRGNFRFLAEWFYYTESPNLFCLRGNNLKILIPFDQNEGAIFF